MLPATWNGTLQYDLYEIGSFTHWLEVYDFGRMLSAESTDPAQSCDQHRRLFEYCSTPS